jgi:transketolase
MQDFVDLEEKALEARKWVIKMLLEAGSGHSAGSLGLADIFVSFYFHLLKHDPKNPLWEERDRLVLSNGHVCPIQYATLAMSGYFPTDELMTLRKINSRLQGHPHRGTLPGIETTSGPLGEGLSQAIGIALALKMDNIKSRVYCITSDGEHQEGNHWEAVMSATQFKLNNLTLIVDRNNIQISGTTEDVMPLEPLREKYLSFNWNVFELDGNNIKELINTLENIQKDLTKPLAIMAKTIPGKGVSFMEGDYKWHGKAPNKEEAEKALKELETRS